MVVPPTPHLGVALRMASRDSGLIKGGHILKKLLESLNRVAFVFWKEPGLQRKDKAQSIN